MRKIQITLVMGVIITMLLQCYYINNDIEYIFKIIEPYSEFVENSIKLEYYVDWYVDNYVLKSIKDRYNITYETSSCLEFNDGTVYGKCNIYNMNNIYKVSIELTNKSIDYKFSELKKQIDKLKVDNAYNNKYYIYQKEKIKNEEKVQEIIKKKIINKKTLKIHNGYVGKGQLIYGENVQYAVVNYNTGGYIIIGTPMIYATY